MRARLFSGRVPLLQDLHPTFSCVCVGVRFASASLCGLRVFFRSTDAQIPLAEVYNDARRNVVVATIIAGSQEIPEVCLFFCDRLLRANRAVKVDR